jgi:Ca2+-binding RTX toxin-like protein
MANFIGTSGTDNFAGGTEADDFYFTSANLSTSDNILGGNGGGDRLIISGNGPINIYGGTPGYSGVIQGMEQIILDPNPFWTTISISAVNSAAGVLLVFGSDGINNIGIGSYSGAPVQTGTVYIYGGGGNDDLKSYFGNHDALFGGDGNDQLGGANCYMDGGSGDDIISAGQYSAVVAGAGNDTIFANENYTVIDGGDGFDKLTIQTLVSHVNVSNVESITLPYFWSMLNLTLPLAQLAGINFVSQGLVGPVSLILTGDGSHSFAGGFLGRPVDVVLTGQSTGAYVSGSAFGDKLQGSDFGDLLFGAAGDDSIYGGSGFDYIYGEDGYDLLHGYLGSDALFGGADGDTIITASYFYGYPQLGGTSYASGGDGNDRLFACGLNDVLLGDAGNDYLFSYSDESTYLYGGTGGDYLDGSNGSDYLDGGDGNDVLKGDSGLDYFYGGAGSDYFVMDTDDWYGGHDVIADFQAGTDYIGLEGYWKTKGAFFDTAAGVCIYYADATGTYMIFVTSTHDVSAVKSAVYYTDL